MDENNNYNNSPYGSNYQQPYVPKHEKPSSESSFGSGMQGINEQSGYNNPPPPQNNYGQQNGYGQAGGYSQPNNYGQPGGGYNQYGGAPQQNGFVQQQGYNNSSFNQQPRRPVYDRFMYEPIGFEELERGQNNSDDLPSFTSPQQYPLSA